MQHCIVTTEAHAGNSKRRRQRQLSVRVDVPAMTPPFTATDRECLMNCLAGRRLKLLLYRHGWALNRSVETCSGHNIMLAGCSWKAGSPTIASPQASRSRFEFSGPPVPREVLSCLSLLGSSSPCLEPRLQQLACMFELEAY